MATGMLKSNVNSQSKYPGRKKLKKYEFAWTMIFRMSG